MSEGQPAWIYFLYQKTQQTVQKIRKIFIGFPSLKCFDSSGQNLAGETGHLEAVTGGCHCLRL